MKKILGVLGTLVVLSFVSTSAKASICPSTIYTNTDCGFVLTISPTASGGAVVTGAGVAGAAPYEGADDQLIGIQNLTGSTYSGTITLTGPAGFTGFDGDGICSDWGLVNGGGYSAYSCGATGYEGPITSFVPGWTSTNISVTVSGLAAGADTFFSLELAPGSSTGGGITVPEPATLSLLGLGLAGLLLRKKSA